LFGASAAFCGDTTSSAIDQNAAHRFGGSAKEVATILKLHLAVTSGEAQPRFMDKSSWLQSVSTHFSGHLVSGKSSQLGVNQRKQFSSRLRVTLFGTLENEGDVAH
jgi:hypothetical protein